VAVTIKNKPHARIGVDVPPAEPPPSPRRRASSAHHSQPFGCCPSFKQKATGQLEGSQGCDLACWLATAHTRGGCILDGGIRQPSLQNSDT